MKRILLLGAMTALTLGAVAITPFEKGKTAPRPRKHTVAKAPVRTAETTVLLNEDFSKFSAGSETEPAADEIFENRYDIPDSYTAQPGWTGRGVHAAGGCVALKSYEYYNEYYDETTIRNGYLTTPQFDLGGTATFTFRARALNDEGASLWVVVCDDDYGPGSDEMELELTPEWKDYTLVATNASLDMPSYIQTSAEEGVALIDDIRLEFKKDRIATPYALPAINNSTTEFTAQWEEVDGADKYLLNVICKEDVANPQSGEVFQNFDAINVNADGKTINAENPNYPAGWTFDLGSFGSEDVSQLPEDACSAPTSIKFDAVGDMIESENLPYPLDGLSFWIKASQTEDDDYNMSLIRIELFHGDTDRWETIAQIPYYYLYEPDGGVYTIANNALGNDVTKVRFSMIQRGLVDFYVDDVRMHYSEQGKTTSFIKDFETEATEHTVSGINPANEYTYYVQAVCGDIVSAKSYPIWVDGIRGLQVETLEPTDVTATSFTANWKPLGHATDYKVEAFRVMTPSEDTEDVVVLEESFDNIDNGTVSNPGTDWISPFDFGAKGWADTAWGATNPAWAVGMAGTTGTNYWMGTAGLVFTPTLDLSCYDGNGIKVEATVVTTVESFVNNNNEYEGEGVFAMIMTDPRSTDVIASGYMDTPTVGSNSGVITIANVPEGTDLSQVIIAFMNKSGSMFFVDNAKITMNVPAGATLMTPMSAVTTQDTGYTFTGLESGVDHAFSVTASATHEYEQYISDPSELRVVKGVGSGVINPSEGSSAGVSAAPGMILISGVGNAPYAVYSAAGICIAKGVGTAEIKAAKGIYIVSVGGKATKLTVK